MFRHSCVILREIWNFKYLCYLARYRGADNSLARPGRKQTTTTEDWVAYMLFIIIIVGILVLFIYRTTAPGSIPGGVTWDFFRSSFRQNHVPWGRLSLWKWVPGISPGVKAAGVFGWQPTTLVVLKVEKIWGLNLPGTRRATSACRGIPSLTIICHFTSLNCCTCKRLAEWSGYVSTMDEPTANGNWQLSGKIMTL